MLSKFDYVKPRTLEEALTYLEQHAGTRILAGGTDLMVMLRRNAEMPDHILDMKGISEAQRLDYKAQEGLFIGAAVTVNQIAEFPVVKEKYSALMEAANSLASYQLRNRATLVGNICNASPGADLAAPLMVYEAKVHIASSKGKREVAIRDFFTGVKKTVLQANEMVIGVSLPDVAAGERAIYLKQARIKGHDLATVGVAAFLSKDNKARVAMAAVAPTPIRLSKLEELLNGQTLTADIVAKSAEEARKEIAPISDVRSSAEYRLHVSGVLVKRALSQLLSGGGK